MTVQELRDSGWIVFESITGSKAYGTDVEGSDEDRVGVYIQPTEDILAGRYIEQISDENNDTTFYEIERFIELASSGNPNVAEVLHMPKDCIVTKTKVWDSYFPRHVLKAFITKELGKKFLGFAKSQLKKAKGTDKKSNWDKTKFERKGVLDFCYVLGDGEDSYTFKKYCDLAHPKVDIDVIQKQISLASVNNFPNIYTMYNLSGPGWGIVGKDSNQIRLGTNIPKEAKEIGKLRFDVDAFSNHCKDYKSYQTWLKERNELRYEHNNAHGQGYDGKNLLHLMRLLNMARDVAQGKGIIVRRPEAEDLKQIRFGNVDLENIYNNAEAMIQQVRELFDESSLEDKADRKLIQDLKLRIRLDHLKQQ